MILIASKYLVPKGYAAITVFPFVFLRSRAYINHRKLINHEQIHLQQQAELLVVPFFLWYAIEYLIRRMSYSSHDEAYRNIGFEREAYSYDTDFNYLKYRQLWHFIKLL